jgi:hypothetical protein
MDMEVLGLKERANADDHELRYPSRSLRFMGFGSEVLRLRALLRVKASE